MAVKKFTGAIAREKVRVQDSLLADLDPDPWGRSNRRVMNRLRPWAPPLTESLDPAFVEEVLGTLFPLDDEGRAPERGLPPHLRIVWRKEWEVREVKLRAAPRRLKPGKAPDPDSVPGMALALANGDLGIQLRRIYTACLKEGRFPTILKAAGWSSSPSHESLLDETGILFERIIVQRLVQHIAGEDPNFSSGQYGFRSGRSTVDVILRVRSLIRTEGGWSCIGGGIRHR